MRIILLHTVQNTGTKFLFDLLMEHPEVCTPNAEALEARTGNGDPDTIWRDYSVARDFRKCGGWKGLEEYIRPHCGKGTVLVWCHHGFLAPPDIAVTGKQVNVGTLRDPLLSTFTYLARLSPRHSKDFPVPWALIRYIPWFEQFSLWRQGRIELLPVDLWGKQGPEKRRELVRCFLESIGLLITTEVAGYVEKWEKRGMFVHVKAKELEDSPISGKSQDLLKAYYAKDLKFIKKEIDPWFGCITAVVKRCKPMFDHFGYDLWWYEDPDKRF